MISAVVMCLGFEDEFVLFVLSFEFSRNTQSCQVVNFVLLRSEE